MEGHGAAGGGQFWTEPGGGADLGALVEGHGAAWWKTLLDGAWWRGGSGRSLVGGGSGEVWWRGGSESKREYSPQILARHPRLLIRDTLLPLIKIFLYSAILSKIQYVRQHITTCFPVRKLQCDSKVSYGVYTGRYLRVPDMQRISDLVAVFLY